MSTRATKYGIPNDSVFQNDSQVRYYQNEVVVYGCPTEWTPPASPAPTWVLPYPDPPHRIGSLIETVRTRLIQAMGERDVLNAEIETLEKMLAVAEGR